MTIKKQTHKKHIISSFLSHSNNKGKNNMFKNLLINYSTKISKRSHNCYFNKLFTNIVLNLFIPFYKKKIKNKYKNLYTTNFKSISDVLIVIIDSIKKNKKRISFDFYLKNEIFKLLNSSNNLYTLKSDMIAFFTDINYYRTQNTDVDFNIDINLQDYIYNKYKKQTNFKDIYYDFYYYKNKYKKINKIKKYK